MDKYGKHGILIDRAQHFSILKGGYIFMNCHLCGKSFNGITFNKTLNNSSNIRICPDCFKAQNDLIRLSYLFGVNDESEYLRLREYFDDIIKNAGNSLEVINTLNEMLGKCDSNKEEMVQIRKRQADEKRDKMCKEEIELEIINEKINNILITTGFDFQGFQIKKYNKVICGETVLGTGFLSELTASVSDFLGEEDNMFAEKLSKARESATTKLLIKAVKCNANAIIGLDFDYVNFTSNLIGVIANGTAVTIEENPIMD